MDAHKLPEQSVRHVRSFCAPTKAQGQTLAKVLIDGRTRKHRFHESHGAFTHGHLNVALSRVRHRSDLAILVDNHNLVQDTATKEMCAVTANVVYYSIVNA